MTTTRAPVRVFAIVPAAGTGRRMGGPKQVFPYADSTLAGTVVQTLIDAGVTGVVVVTRSVLVDALKLPADGRVTIALNDSESEMIDSIRIGLARLCGADKPDEIVQPSPSPVAYSPATRDGVMVVPADMPTLSVDTCRRCIIAYEADPQRIVIAAHAARRGHPIVFPFSMRSVIDRLDGGLNALRRSHAERVHLVEVNDPGVAQDVDTVAEYESLQDPHGDARDRAG